MKSHQEILNNHLTRVKDNKSDVISQAMTLSTSTFPLLMAYFLRLRKLNAVHTRLDDQNETSQMIQEYNYACEHNLLFFLTVTKQFNLIRELFEHNEKLAILLKLIKEIEKEHDEARAHNNMLLEATFKAHLKEQEKLATTQPALNNLLMFEYYDGLFKDITFKHHNALSNIYAKAHAGRMARMNNMCNAVLNNPTVSLADKKAFLDMRREERQEFDQINNMPTTHPDGKPNHEAAEKKQNLLKAHNEKWAKKLQDKGEEVASKPGTDPKLKETLVAIVNEDREAEKATQEEVVVETENYQEDVKEIKQEREVYRAASRDQVESLIKIIKEVPTRQIPEESRKEYTQSLTRLKNLHEELKQIDSPAAQKKLLRDCVSELERINEIVSPVMDNETKQTFTNNLDLLTQTIKETAVSEDFALHHTEDFAPQKDTSVSNDMAQSLDVVDEILDSEKPEKSDVINSSSMLSGSFKMEIPTNSQPATSSLSTNNNQNTNSDLIDKMRQYKTKMQENRPSKASEIDIADFAQQKEKFIKLSGELKTKLEEDMFESEFSEKDIQDYERISSLCEEMRSDSCTDEQFEQAVSEIKSCSERLLENHKTIADTKSQLDETSQKFSVPQEHREELSSLRL